MDACSHARSRKTIQANGEEGFYLVHVLNSTFRLLINFKQSSCHLIQTACSMGFMAEKLIAVRLFGEFKPICKIDRQEIFHEFILSLFVNQFYSVK